MAKCVYGLVHWWDWVTVPRDYCVEFTIVDEKSKSIVYLGKVYYFLQPMLFVQV